MRSGKFQIWLRCVAVHAVLVHCGWHCSTVAAQVDQEGQSLPTWTSSEGTEIQAEFVRLTDDGVVLRSDKGESEVPLAKLSIDSHLQAIMLANPEAFSKPLPKAQVEIPPAEPTNPIDVETTLQSPFTGQETIDQFLDTIDREYSSGNYFVFWHCLPKPMQASIEELAVKTMAKIGPGPITQIRSLLQDANTIVAEKREFILGHPDVAANPERVEQLKKEWPVIQAYLTAISKEELWRPENFEQGKFVPWVAKFAAAIGQYHDAMNEADGGQSNNLVKSMFTVTQQSADSAKLEFTPEQQPPQTVQAQKLPKVWIVVPWMEGLRQAVDRGLEQVESASNLGGGIQGVLAISVVPALSALKNADTQEEFNEAIENIQAMAGSFVPPGGLTAGGAGPGGAAGGQGSPGQGPGGRGGGSAGPRLGGPGR